MRESGCVHIDKKLEIKLHFKRKASEEREVN